jgi:hypothetical protein
MGQMSQEEVDAELKKIGAELSKENRDKFYVLKFKQLPITPDLFKPAPPDASIEAPSDSSYLEENMFFESIFLFYSYLIPIACLALVARFGFLNKSIVYFSMILSFMTIAYVILGDEDIIEFLKGQILQEKVEDTIEVDAELLKNSPELSKENCASIKQLPVIKDTPDVEVVVEQDKPGKAKASKDTPDVEVVVEQDKPGKAKASKDTPDVEVVVEQDKPGKAKASLVLQKRKGLPNYYTGIVEYKNGDKVWYLNGELHREGGPAIEDADGYKSWWINGKLHRLDGPAIEYYDGSKSWWINGKLHRLDGPAIEYPNGTKFWYLNGTWLTEKEWIKRTSH